MRYSRRKRGICLQSVCFAICGAFGAFHVTQTALAEDTVVYGYMRTASSNASYMLVPQVVDISNPTPSAIFDRLRSQKLPTYGATTFEAKSNTVAIDDSKCGYSAIISAEISASFAHHGFKLPKYTCGASQVASGYGQLPRYLPVIPLWQALDPSVSLPPAVRVQVGESCVSLKAFRALVQKRDKSLMQAVEDDLRSGNGFVRSGIMRGMMVNGFAGAQKRVLQALTGSDDISVNAALEALLATDSKKIDKTVLEAMRRVLAQPSPYQIQRATAALAAPIKDLRDDALAVLFQSSRDDAFQSALAALDKYDRAQAASFFDAHAEKILSAAAPSHIAAIVSAMHGAGCQSVLTSYLRTHPATENAILAASYLADHASGALLEASLAVLLESSDDIAPYDAWDRLLSLSPAGMPVPSAIMRGLKSPHVLIRHWAYRALESSQSPCKDFATYLSDPDGAQLSAAYAPMIAVWLGTHCSASDLESVTPASLRTRARQAGNPSIPADLKSSAALHALARSNPAQAVEIFSKRVHATDAATRRDLAYALRWLPENADSLRAAMLKDSDETVVSNVLWSVSAMKPDQMTIPLAKEIFSRVRQSTENRIIALHVLPALVGEKNAQTITTYIGNEMFDDDIGVKIAAIRALSEIAKTTSQKMTRENAFASLSLMVQDASPVIVFHTLRGLMTAGAPDLDNLISATQKSYPDIYRRLTRDR